MWHFISENKEYLGTSNIPDLWSLSNNMDIFVCFEYDIWSIAILATDICALVSKPPSPQFSPTCWQYSPGLVQMRYNSSAYVMVLYIFYSTNKNYVSTWIAKHMIDSGLAAKRRQAIIWTNADLNHWHIYAALGEDELKKIADMIRHWYIFLLGMWCWFNPLPPFRASIKYHWPWHADSSPLYHLGLLILYDD